MRTQIKQLIATLTLVSFLAVVIFSLVFMIPGQDGTMSGDCPLSAIDTSTCPQNTLAMAIHHISVYTDFLNVPTRSPMVLAAVVLLLAIVGAIISSARLHPGSSPPARVLADRLSDHSHRKKIIRWLSLLENSPSYL